MGFKSPDVKRTYLTLRVSQSNSNVIWEQLLDFHVATPTDPLQMKTYECKFHLAMKSKSKRSHGEIICANSSNILYGRHYNGKSGFITLQSKTHDNHY